MPLRVLTIWTLLLLTMLFTQPADAGPVIVPDQAIMRMDDLGLYQVGYQLRRGPEVALPIGWVGGLDSPTGAACQSVGMQNGREAWLLHPPWRGKTGVTFQDYTFQLPKCPKIVLYGATALRSDGVGKSDGVTFRVFVDGQKRLDVNRADSTWKQFVLDLTADAGRTVTMRFETDPGPRDDASFDFALWGDRQLALTDYHPAAVHHPAPLPVPLTRLTSQQTGSVVPLSGFASKSSVRLAKEAVFQYKGPDGTLTYHWAPGDGSSFLGNISLTAKMQGDKPATVPLATGAHLDWTAAATPTGAAFVGAVHGFSVTLIRTYSVDGQTATVKIRGALQDKSLVFAVTCDKPLVRGLDGGDWGPTLRRQSINLPYYSNPIWYLSHENLFAGAFLDWTDSYASSQAGTHATYDPLTDGTRNPLRERLIYTASWQLAETLPNIPNTPSPYRSELGKRVVLDIWGDSFAGVQSHLRSLADEQFGPGIALLHVWQHFGYDNGLPQHVPANTDQGGDEALASLTRASQKDDILMALHENYVDYYPNYPGFSDTDIALQSDSSRGPAWYNPGTKIQSFAVKPTRILPLAQTQGPKVMATYGSAACYLDVHSAVPPWFHVDSQARLTGAGKFQEVSVAHRELWAYERELHHGPVFGEGNNHWYWSGLLDGVEAQFGQGWPSGQGTSAPLLVDFDLLKIHPLQLNHGMGYYERWWDQGPGTGRSLLSFLDQYRMQEVAYGHEGFLGGEAWHDLGLSWLESHLMTPLTSRTALASPTAIDYLVEEHWLDTSTIAKSNGPWSVVRIKYNNGLTVWANGSGTPLKVGTMTIPSNGWLAQGNGLTAGTTLRADIVSDFAQTPESVFANARPAEDWETPGQIRIRPSIAQFTATGVRTFTATYRWTVGQNILTDYHCFVHFTGTKGDSDDIKFQQDHTLSVPTSQWKSGQTVTDGPWDITVPDNIAPGDYKWTIGLFQPGSSRLTLQGTSDSQSRIILGTVHVSPAGVTFTPQTDLPSNKAPVNSTSRVLDFGPVRTNGSVFLKRVGADWVLQPFPRDRPFTIQLSAARFGHPAGVKVVHGWWTLPLTGAPTYHWPARR